MTPGCLKKARGANLGHLREEPVAPVTVLWPDQPGSLARVDISDCAATARLLGDKTDLHVRMCRVSRNKHGVI